jgi:hypothetical protein
VSLHSLQEASTVSGLRVGPSCNIVTWNFLILNPVCSTSTAGECT